MCQDRRHRYFTSGLTTVGVCGSHDNHRRADAGGLFQPQAVVLLLSENGHLVVGVVHIDDHLQRETFSPLSLILQYH